MPSAPAAEEVEEAMLWGSGGGGCSFQESRSPLPASCLRPPNVGLLGGKVRLRLGNASRGPAPPAPRVVSSPCLVRGARQVPAGPVRGARGAGPAQVGARRPRGPRWLANRPALGGPIRGVEEGQGSGAGGLTWGGGERRGRQEGREGKSGSLPSAELATSMITK